MKITLLGAAGGEVTGSCYLVETLRSRVLIDCGQFQGGPQADALNHGALPDVGSLSAVLLTHAHLDHTGRLPLLAKAGYKGPVFTTPASVDMTGLILRDAARIQTQDAERQNRIRERAGESPFVPMFSGADAEQIISQLRPVPYREPVSIAPGVQACFVEAGHMLGSASIQLLVDDGKGARRTIVFSGDLGPKSAPILKEFEPFTSADAVFMESTYGNRDHQPFAETVQEFVQIITEAIQSGGKVLVPTFAVGRAQLLTGLLAWAFREKKLKPFPVFLDSPMAIEASAIYQRHPELYDEETVAFLKARPIGLDLKTLHMTASPAESRAINGVPGPCMILAGSGMCTAGRILHHLRHNLWSPQAHVIIVGYQGHGTLGRQLVDGATKVTIFGETIAVRAKVHTLGGFSAHAGQADLLAWFDALAASKPRVCLTHGEPDARNVLRDVIAQRHGITPHLPAIGETIEL
ncbi:MBL fold metallo-hydrolase [Opitutus sp. ER46]|uniref:MBL fold metallo-hydrolase RNA specificity domain-containing protein n=1 Tax=Opitutus sp. ER46 TaxID=2161864 RepID=UPI000D309A90|nr:MBL fold metallo-hydrolase [Opitutus sp. ER46]PTX96633.1 MBL fold metallo-hydrolase [Opitutus sp. ER46]